MKPVSGPPFKVPPPTAVHEVRLPDGDGITVRRHGNPDGPRIVLSHGNGFAADSYYLVWGRLLDEFEVIVFDLRNHGWNEVGSVMRHNVPQFAKDLDYVTGEVQRHFGQKPTLGVFHSTSALAASLSPSLAKGYEGLFLLDPPLCKPGITYSRLDASGVWMARRARRRAVRFESLEKFVWMMEIIGGTFFKPVAGAWELLGRSTFREEVDGGWVLRCPREYEAYIAEYISALGVVVELTRLQCPVRVLGADPTLPYSFVPSFNLRVLVECDYDFIPEATHLLFLEKPDVCAARIRAFAARCGLVLP